ncbi:hypothetical protein O9G_001874 [Rozella allomycis CSF55]|uniref:Uncharacterized protein n=1 Tax=Rozella allomycis (strain CSF55) TaxID=988480 RepID=A0A075AVA9_ROZAC|nr:hypothetical protein O9G_001874 [Rozella allomycis CSF55]|eukprot:EPZ34261.1 hypothetical protein O9G_001874 [Rozella allomycis CSF55]
MLYFSNGYRQLLFCIPFQLDYTSSGEEYTKPETLNKNSTNFIVYLYIQRAEIDLSRLTKVFPTRYSSSLTVLIKRSND